MNDDAKKPKKRGRPEERLVIEEDPETAIQKLFQPKAVPTDEEIRQMAKEAVERSLELLRKQAADARQRGYIAAAEEIEKGIARIERLPKQGRQEPGGD